ncbi:MAG TPA: hypothetical protein VK801_15435 [Caulobacteraceae bacterium]|nr:hypothetical protein [Caulobacteraceae bacterium]
MGAIELDQQQARAPLVPSGSHQFCDDALLARDDDSEMLDEDLQSLEMLERRGDAILFLDQEAV